MKEVPGGAIPEGMFRVPVEWSENQGQQVSVTTFDPAEMDTLTDRCLEELKAGRSIDGLVKSFIAETMAEELIEARCEGLKDALAQVIASPQPKAIAGALCFASGLHITLGLSGPQLAKNAGISKQAFFQEVERIQYRFGGRLVRMNARDEAAREKMRKRNYRR